MREANIESLDDDAGEDAGTRPVQQATTAASQAVVTAQAVVAAGPTARFALRVQTLTLLERCLPKRRGLSS